MRIAFALGVATLVLLAGTGRAPAQSKAPADPVADPARGLVFRGLERGRPGGPCETGFVVRLGGKRVGCTHGPDPAPQGQDVRRKRPLSELTAAFAGGGGTATAPATGSSVPCFGDGVSGNRVQAVYAYPENGSNNYGAVAPLIRRWAAVVDQVFNDSAAETGGVRHVRFVTDADCQLEVAKVSLSPEGVASMGGTASALAAQGHNRADRKYLVWVDAYVICGMAAVEADERPSSDNLNDGNVEVGMLARVDRGCWGWAERSVEAHELAHTLGAVQPGAPNASALYHCIDESDLMCYDDDGTLDGMVQVVGGSAPLSQRCPPAHERLLDCNHDDYFHTDPSGSSYLGRRWNVAQSSFLTSEGPASVPDTEPPVANAPVAIPRGVLGRSRVPVQVELSATDTGGIAGYWLWQSTNGGQAVPVSASPLAGSAKVRLLPGRSYTFVVQAVDLAGNLSEPVWSRPFTLRAYQEKQASYSASWRRKFGRRAYGRFQSSSSSSVAQARFSFSGRGVAWVARTSRRGGRARVYIDGRYVDTVSLYSSRVVARKVVFRRRWTGTRFHTIAIRSVASAARPRVSVDAFVVLR
jgi:hypothetical protein